MTERHPTLKAYDLVAAERDRLKALNADLGRALEGLEDYTSKAINEINDQDTGWYYQLIAATQKARAILAKAKRETP